MKAGSCICLFSSLYSPSMGGVETYTESVAKALTAIHCRVIVVTCALADDSGISARDGVETLRLPCRLPLSGRYPIPSNNNAARKLWRWLEDQPINFIEVHARFYPLSAMALAFAERINVTPIVLEHGSAHLTMGNPLIDKGVQAVEHAMTKRCLAHPANYYAVSHKASKWLRHFGINSCGVLPNSIDADMYVQTSSSHDFRSQLGITRNTLLVSFIGRLVPEKGILSLAEASKLLENEEILIVAGGAGPLKEKLECFEGSSFKLLGRLERQDVAALLLQSDLMCLPSRSEGFATSLLEAAACSTPSLVTDVGGVEELIPSPEYGFILPSANPHAIADAIRHASSNRDRLRSIGEKSAKLVRESYSWKAAAEKTLEACAIANNVK